MKHVLKQKVFYSDTDAYGVVWHGNYLRWLEMGRVMYCENFGLKLSDLANDDIVLPVAELNLKYKNSAKLDDNIIITTEVKEYGKFYVVFHQTVANKDNEKIYTEATVKVVAVNKDGKLYRSLPEQILKIL